MANKSTILIIDDEKDIRESLSEILLDEGYETYLAADANEARKLIKQENNVDIILLDIWMPDCDGITLLKELKVSQKLKQPIIMMSGHGTIDIIEQKLKTIVNLLNDLQEENKVLKDKIHNQDETIKSLNLKIYEASQKLENLLGQIPTKELL
jgi:DNA-binding NtrC family response regulator